MLPGATHPDECTAGKGIGLDDALMLLKLQCVARDLSCVAARLQTILLDPVAAKACLSHDTMLTSSVHNLALLQAFLSELDQLVDGETALDFERQGWHLPCSVDSLRSWTKLMAIFSGRCQAELLRQWASALAAVTADCKASVPSWRAAFDKDCKLLESLALQVFSGKHAAIVSGHNRVHTFLATMNEAAKLLAISPRLKDNDATRNEIALALEEMSQASLANVVCLALDLVGKFKDDSSGAKSAQEFLANHSRSAYPQHPRGPLR